jgi:hypothetical protein
MVADQFSHLKSVGLHIAHQVFCVSNINGKPLYKDGNGFISKVLLGTAS